MMAFSNSEHQQTIYAALYADISGGRNCYEVISARYLFRWAEKFRESDSTRYRSLLQECLTLDPGQPEALYALYAASRSTPEVAFALARQAFELPQTQSPSQSRVWLHRALVKELCLRGLASAEAVAEVRAVLARITDEQQRDYSIVDAFAPALEAASHFDAAEAEYSAVMERDTPSKNGLVGFVSFLLRRGRSDEASELAQKHLFSGHDPAQYIVDDVCTLMMAAGKSHEALQIYQRYFADFHCVGFLSPLLLKGLPSEALTDLVKLVASRLASIEFSDRGTAYDFLIDWKKSAGAAEDIQELKRQKEEWAAEFDRLRSLLIPLSEATESTLTLTPHVERILSLQREALLTYGPAFDLTVNHGKLCLLIGRIDWAVEALRTFLPGKNQEIKTRIFSSLFHGGWSEEKLKVVKAFPELLSMGIMNHLPFPANWEERTDIRDLLHLSLEFEPDRGETHFNLAGYYLAEAGKPFSGSLSVERSEQKAKYHAWKALRHGAGGSRMGHYGILAQYILFLANTGRSGEAITELLDWLEAEGITFALVEVLGEASLGMESETLALAGIWLAQAGADVFAQNMLMAAHRKSGQALYLAMAYLAEEAMHYLREDKLDDITIERSNDFKVWGVVQYGEEYSNRQFEVFSYFAQRGGGGRLKAELSVPANHSILTALGCREAIQVLLEDIEQGGLSLLRKSIRMLRLTVYAYIDYPQRVRRCLPVLLSRLFLYLSLRKDDLWLTEARRLCRELFLRGEDAALREKVGELNALANERFRGGAFREAIGLFAVLEDVVGYLRKIVGFRDWQETWARRTEGNARRAAYAWWRLGDAEQAVLTLESGLATLLSDELALREIEWVPRLAEDDAAALTARWMEWKSLLEQRLSGHPSVGQSNALAEIRGEIEDILLRNGASQALTMQDLEAIVASTGPLAYLCHTAHGGFLAILSERGLRILDLPTLTDQAVERVMTSYQQAYGDFARVCEHRSANARREMREWVTQLDTVLRWLWQEAVGPLLDILEENGDHHCTIIGGGRLRTVPWAAAHATPPERPPLFQRLMPLLRPWERRVRRDAKPVYAIDQVAFAYAPNAATLRAAQAILQVGDASRSLLSVCWLGEGRAGFQQEVRAASENYRQVTNYFLSDDGEIDEVRAKIRLALEQATVLQFSGHGKIDPQAPLDRFGLLLGYRNSRETEWLSLREIMSFRLSLRLAVLSACETALDIQTNLSQEAIGLPTALLQCGAAGVIAPLWAVSNTATAHLISRYHALWSPEGNLSPAQALRQAQIWLRDTLTRVPDGDHVNLAPRNASRRVAQQNGEAPNIGRGPYAAIPCDHPIFWAGFVVSGI